LDKAPDAFRTISEVADEIDVPQHVLRFWESRFAQIKPMKRGGGRRYYRPEDVDLLRGIRHLLYGEGYTIRGVQRILRDEGAAFVQNVWRAGAVTPPPSADDQVEDDFEEITGPGADERAEPDLSSFALPASQVAEPAQVERREPAFAAPTPAVAPPSPAKLGAATESRLRAALDELVACRGLIDAAMSDAGQNGRSGGI
jgi:DNA-binding transcriptional MerR regulator